MNVEPLGGRSPLNPYVVAAAVLAHMVELAVAEEAAAERLLGMVAEEAPRARDSRLSGMSKREHLNVADLTGRRHGRTYGPSRGGLIPVKWLDTGEREVVHEDGLLLRFTTQSTSYAPKSERDQKVVEEAEVAA